MRSFYVLLFLSLLSPYCSAFAQFYTIRQTEPLRQSPAFIETKMIETTPETCEEEALSIENNMLDILQCSLPLDRELCLTSSYGYRKDPFTGKNRFHHGLDLRCACEQVLAMFQGEVKKVGYNKGLGNYVVLSHKVFEVTYAHLEYATVGQGDTVVPGTIVGISGSTGRSTGPHLHIELRYQGKRCDPLPLLAFVERTVKLQHKISERIMDTQKTTMTALEHVQEAYASEYIAFLNKREAAPSEENALLFLEMKEQDVTTNRSQNS